MINGNNKVSHVIKQFEEHLKNSHYSQNTVYNYILDITNFIYTCRIDSIKDSDCIQKEVDRYFENMNGNLSDRSKYRHTKSLKCFFKFLTLNNIISEVPRVPKLRFIPKLPDRLDEEHIKKIFSSCDYIENPYRMKAIFSLLYGCGLRVSELVNIRLSDCDFNTKFVKIYGKNRKERIIPLSDKIVNILQAYIEKERKFFKYAQTSEYLFLSRKKGKITRVQIFNLIKKLQELSGIDKKVYPHLLRHSFATKLLESGVNLRIIQELLGHSKLSTTTVYTHIDYKKLQEIYDKYF